MRQLVLDNHKVSYGAVLLAAIALYVTTCAPGALWQDSGMVQYRVWHNDIKGGLGLALSHPLFYVLAIGAKHVPFGEFVYKVNLVSAIAAAIAVANLFLLLRLWFGRNMPAVIAAVTFAVSHTFWQHACVVETYDLYMALLFAELIMLLQYVRTGRVSYLYWLGLFNGLAIADHMLGSIALFCYAIFFVVLLAKKNIRFRDLFAIILLWVIGAIPYEYLIIKDIIQSGNLTATVASALFGDGWQRSVLNTCISGKIIKENLMLIAYNFPTPNILFFFGGLYSLKKESPTRGFAYALLAMTFLFLVFAFRYTVPDRYAFFIPFYGLMSVLTGVGYNLMVERTGRRVLRWVVLAFALLPIPTYIIVPIAAEKMRLNISAKREIPYRNNYVWFLRPWQPCYDGPERFAHEALSKVESNAIIIADGTTVYPLWYVQTVEGTNPDVKVVAKHGSYESPMPIPTEETIKQIIDKHPVYVVSPVAGYCPSFLLEGYNFAQAGVLWKVVER